MNFRRVAGFAVGPISAAVISLVTVPITAWVFVPSDLGRLNLFQVILSFALLFSVLGLDQAYAREYHESNDRQRLLLSCFLPGFALLTIGGLATASFATKFSALLYGSPDESLYLMTLAALAASYVSRFLSIILRMEERGWAYSASQIMPKVLSMALIVGIALLQIKTDFRLLLGIVLSSIIVVMFIYAWNTRREWTLALRKQIVPHEIKKLLRFGLPLAFSGLAYWGLVATSTFALRKWAGLDELAVYSVTMSFAGVAVIFQTIFSTVWAPTVYRWAANGVDMRKVDDVARHALVIVCLIFVAAGLFSWIADYVLPPHYRVVKFLLACAVMPSLLYTLSEVTAVGIAISRRTEWTIWITVTALLTNIGMSWWLVPRSGSAGAVMANAVAFFVFFILRTEASAMLWRQFPRAKLYGLLGLMILLAVSCVALREKLPSFYQIVWLAPLFIVALASRREIADLAAVFGKFKRGL